MPINDIVWDDEIDSTQNDTKQHISRIESGGTRDQYTAQNPTSSAYGKYQVIDDTNETMAKRLGISVQDAKTPQGQEMVMNGLMKEYSSQLDGLGVPVTNENMYVIHQLGYPRAKRFFSGNLTQEDVSVMEQNLPKSMRGSDNTVELWSQRYAGVNKSSDSMSPSNITWDDENNFDGRKSESGIPLRAGENMPDKERDILDKAYGAVEAGKAVATGATTGLAGHIYGTFKGLAEQIRSGEFGTDKAAKMIEEEANRYAAMLTDTPDTEAGQEYTKNVAEVASAGAAMTPLMVEAGSVARGMSLKPRGVKSNLKPSDIAVKNATDRGIPVMGSDINPPKTFFGRSVQQMGERVPVAGTGGMRKAQQAARVDAIKDAVSTHLGEIGDNAVEVVAKSLIEKSNSRWQKLADIKNNIMSKMPSEPVNMSKTMMEIDKQSSILRKINTKSSRAAADMLDEYKQSFSGQDIKTVEMVRKDLGGLFKNQDLASIKSQGDKAVGKIYSAVKDDITGFIEKNGNKYDAKAWNVANDQLAAGIKDKGTAALKYALKKGELTPEDVGRLVFSKKPSELKMLYKYINKDGRAAARSAVMQKVLDNAMEGESISPAKFKTQIGKLKPQIEVLFAKEDRMAINGLVEALEFTKRADEFAVSPPTGVQNYTTFGAMALTDVFGGMGQGVAAGATVGAITRMIESIPVKRALIRLGKTTRGTKQHQLAIENLITVSQTANKEKE